MKLNIKRLFHGFADICLASSKTQKHFIEHMLQPSIGGKAAVRKAPAGKSAKMLDSTEALNLRAKAAFDHSQRQEQRKPAAKRCVQATAACVRACRCVCVCVFVCSQTFPCLAGCKIAAPHCKTAVSNCKTAGRIASYCKLATLYCKIAIPHGKMLA